MAGLVAGVDVGGTFTDLVIFDPGSGQVRLAKVPTTLPNQSGGVLAAFEAAGADLSALDLIVHGTTTTTNAVLEQRVSALEGGVGGIDDLPGVARQVAHGGIQLGEGDRQSGHDATLLRPGVGAVALTGSTAPASVAPVSPSAWPGRACCPTLPAEFS